MDESLSRTDKELMDIYNRHAKTVYRICFIYLKNVSDTEDAVQNIFIKLINYEKNFSDCEHEKAWLIVTAQNHCKNLLKHWWRKKRIEIENVPETSYTQELPFNNILKDVLSLPHKYKIVLYLFYYEGYKTREIAKMLNIKESTVRSRLRVGRKQLKIKIEEDN